MCSPTAPKRRRKPSKKLRRLRSSLAPIPVPTSKPFIPASQQSSATWRMHWSRKRAVPTLCLSMKALSTLKISVTGNADTNFRTRIGSTAWKKWDGWETMWRYALAVSFLVSGVAFADNTLEVNPVTKKLDLVLDNSSAGVITGITATFTGYDCTLNSNGGALTTDSAGNLRCSDDDTGGGGGNSFETIAVPAGASVVADSSTDTLTLTETTFLTFTGTAATDTIDITQVTTDIGTDGLIAANAVALGTDTTNAYVADLAAGTYIDVSGGGAETATVTVTHDPTEMEAVTFGAGGNASNVWTNNLSGTDPTLTWGSALVTIGGALTSTGTATGG